MTLTPKVQGIIRDERGNIFLSGLQWWCARAASRPIPDYHALIRRTFGDLPTLRQHRLETGHTEFEVPWIGYPWPHDNRRTLDDAKCLVYRCVLCQTSVLYNTLHWPRPGP